MIKTTLNWSTVRRIKSGGYYCSSVKHEVVNDLLHGIGLTRDIINSVQILTMYTCGRN